MEDIGTLPGAFVTVAGCCHTINNLGEVVGFSIGQNGSTAFLWKDGNMMDLNTLIPADSPWYLQAANSINNVGEITGQGTINGEVHAFLATPSSPLAVTKAVVTPANLTTSASSASDGFSSRWGV